MQSEAYGAVECSAVESMSNSELAEPAEAATNHQSKRQSRQ